MLMIKLDKLQSLFPACPKPDFLKSANMSTCRSMELILFGNHATIPFYKTTPFPNMAPSFHPNCTLKQHETANMEFEETHR